MKKPLVLPKFKNEDEEREFWDKIDLGEYFEPSDFKHISFPNLKRTKQIVSLRIEPEIIDILKEQASKRDMPYQSLMREYIKAGVEKHNDK